LPATTWASFRVDHDDVDLGVEQRLGAGETVLADAGGGGDPEAALGVLAGGGMGLGFFDILDRDQADAAVVLVDHQQLLDPVLVQQALGLVPLGPFLHRDQVVSGHELADRLAAVLGEAHVAVGQDANQRPGAALDHRNAGDAVALHQGQRIGQGLVGIDGDRVHHHAAFELLDLAHLVGLLLDREVLVDHAHAAGLGHGDGEPAIGHGIHGRGEQRDAQLDRAGQTRARVGLAGQDGGFRRLEKDVVESERFADLHANLFRGPKAPEWDWRAIIQIGPAMPSELR
jgi:hypothetical protein